MSNNDQRSNVKKDIWVIVGSFLLIFILLFTDFGNQTGKIYDCKEAHWHPDYPIEVKEECKRLLIEEQEKLRWQKNKSITTT